MKLINNINCLLLAFNAGFAFSPFGLESVASELQSKVLSNHRFSDSSIYFNQQLTCFLCSESGQGLALKTETLTHRQPVNDEPKTPADVGGSR